MHAIRYGRLTLAIAVSALALAACSKKAENTDTTSSTTTTTSTTAAPTNETAAAPAATTPAASGAPAASNTDTVDGTKLASFTGDATKGGIVFLQCKTCHELDKNKIGPMLKGVVGRAAGTVAGFTYSAANKNSGITWSPEKLFQYLEKPQRIVPGTKMTFAGLSDAQKRADVIAYLKAN
ncbi:cytochrome c family protein [Sphingomonas sp. RT2P30]|uniref:c-type cytochrome n=1 Tax=Parasphingomonas halimpatiens TaxID=3096162 RepID=UPI002FCC1FAA